MRMFSFSLLLCAALLGAPTHAQDVGELFKQLPRELVMHTTPAQRQQLLAGKTIAMPEAWGQPAGVPLAINVLDRPNGYLNLDAWEGVWEMACWKMADQKTRLVAVLRAQCGPTCDWKMTFLQRGEDGALRDVSAQMLRNFPKTSIEFFATERLSPAQRETLASQSFLFFKLPQKGQDITVSLDEAGMEELLDADAHESLHQHIHYRKVIMRWTGEHFVRTTAEP